VRLALRTSAIGLALAAMTMTSPVRADGDEAPPPSPAASAEPATPLVLRPSKPLELAPEPAPSSVGWKVAAVLALAGGLAFYLRKGRPGARVKDGGLVVVRRVPVGMRSELLVVNVEGQRLLVGVTPHSIQSLAILDSDEPQPAEEAVRASTPLGERFAAMLDSARQAIPREAPSRPVAVAHPAPPAPHPEPGAPVADQARGLLSVIRSG
jgi:flagellar protein FliO/FliZ